MRDPSIDRGHFLNYYLLPADNVNTCVRIEFDILSASSNYFAVFTCHETRLHIRFSQLQTFKKEIYLGCYLVSAVHKYMRGQPSVSGSRVASNIFKST